ncbi:MAG: hypothetical protein CMC05_11385 [Flavobacteriaceae bacterium]|nr:hypothetical protein [Flavobacteriaceae bacterium]MBD10589.1 hypothetical protein [Flavobacteriaceae bacterium]|tara:strand:- start:1243 stop:1599 length:357 start_codon:yes stop_codon:yes gene_type:complete
MRYLKLLLAVILLVSCEEIIEVVDISNENVVVLAPTDTSTLTITDINFSWEAVEDAEQYKLQIATPNFESANQIVLDTTITTTNFNQDLELGNYEWRVRAENSDYQTAYSTQSFTIEE